MVLTRQKYDKKLLCWLKIEVKKKDLQMLEKIAMKYG